MECFRWWCPVQPRMKGLCEASTIDMHQMQINMHGFMQVVMGYGHNKLSLEEAEELLKEVNFDLQKTIFRIF